MSILHGVGEYDRGYGEGYFYSFALAIPLSRKAGYIYNPVVPKGWGHLVLQKINLGSFLFSLAEFLASSPYSILTLQVTSLFLNRSCHLLPKPDSSSSIPRHLLDAAPVHQARLFASASSESTFNIHHLAK
jgi:hypothetical protein